MESVGRNAYFAAMAETTAAVKDILQRHLTASTLGPVYTKSMSLFVSHRLSAVRLLKPFVARTAYEAAGGLDSDRILKLAAAMECINISTYQANAGLDGKYRATTDKERSRQLALGMICREISHQMIESAGFDECTTAALVSLLSAMNRDIYYGQFCELSSLQIDAVDGHLMDVDAYLYSYISKCDFLSGRFTMFMALSGAVAAGAVPAQAASICEFARNYGIGLNIVNDMSDYLPPSDAACPPYKTPHDQCADIRSGRVLLPTFLLLRDGGARGRSLVRRWTESLQTFSQGDHEELLASLIDCGALGFTFHVAKQYMVRAKAALKRLPASVARTHFSVMASSIRTNKFVRRLREYGMTIRKAPHGLPELVPSDQLNTSHLCCTDMSVSCRRAASS